MRIMRHLVEFDEVGSTELKDAEILRIASFDFIVSCNYITDTVIF